MPQLPEVLVERLRSGRCVLCAGAGLRVLAGMPNWSGVLDRLTDRLAAEGEPAARIAELKELIRAKRLFLCAGYLERRLGPEAFGAAVRDALRSPEVLPEPVRLLGRLPFRTIITTAADDLLERAFERDGVRPNVCTLADGRDLRREARGRLVLKVMGDLARPETMCYTVRDFERALDASPGYRSFGQEMVQQRSLLLLGFDPEDQDFNHLFTRFFVHADTEHEHFLFMPGAGEIVREEYFAKYRMHVLGEGTLEEFVRAIAAAVEGAMPRVLDEDDLEGWLRWLALEPDSAEAQDGLLTLERKARAASDWERVVEVLLGRVESAEPGPMRADILCEVARVFENQLGDLPKAFTALVAAFREQPERTEVVGELERLASAADLWADLVSEFAQLAEAQGTPERFMQLGKWYLQRLGQLEHAIQWLEQAYAKAPDSDEIADLYAEALRVGGRWSDLAALTEKRITSATDPVRRGELLLLLADLHETRTRDLEKAIGAYRRAAQIEGTEALANLERIFRRRERWRDLVDLLGRRAEATVDPEEARALRREVGEILADRMGDHQAAIAWLETVVSENPRDTAALRALERIYDRTGHADRELATLERLAEAVQTPEERILLLRRLAAEWEERPGGLDRAAQCLDGILALRSDDEEALRTLARTYRNARRFPQLIDTLGRHIAITDSPLARRDLYAEVGHLYEDELSDVPRAIEAFLCVEEAGGDASAELARLYQKAGEWSKAVDLLPRLAARTADPAARVELLYQAGHIARERLGDDALSEAHFIKTLEADPAHLPSMTALAQVYQRRGEWLRAAKLMVEAADRTANRLDKTRLLYEAGIIHQDHLDDEPRALELYVRALALDPEHLETAIRLSFIYEQREQWAELEPVLDVVARKVDRDDRTGAALVFTRLGYAAKQIGNDDKAIRAYRQANELDPIALPALAGLAGLLAKKGEHADAAKLYQTLLHHHGDGLSEPERLDIYYRHATIQHKLGQTEKALNLYSKVLEIDPHHKASLQALVDLNLSRGKLGELVEAKRALAALAEGEDRGKLLEEIGDLLLDKLEDPVQALGAYQAALESRPGRALLLHKMLDLYTEQKQWKQATEIIERLIELETDPARRAKYRYAAAVIQRDELSEEDKALEGFEQVLDDAPDTQIAFENIEEILSRRQDWKALERAYRRMIKRLPAEGLNDIRLRLWSNLGEVALGKLGNREVALAALEVASSLDRGNTARHEQLAQLYLDGGPDEVDKAIGEQQWLIRKQPDRLAAYMTLRKLYNETRQFDKMWCLCQALRFLKRAEPEEIEFFERLRPLKFTPAKRKLTEEVWQKHIVHPEEDRLVDAIFALIGPALAVWSAQPHKAFGLSRKEKTDPAQHEHLAARAFRYAVETLGIAPPELYFRPDQPAGVQVANAIDKDKGQIVPAFIVGAALLEKPREKEVVFEISKRLAFLRPERYIRYALPTTQALASALRAGLVVSSASNGARVDGETVKLAEHLRRVLPPPMVEQLRGFGRKLLEFKGEVIDLSSWLATSDLSASRAAFALTNDFETAARMVSTEQAGLSPLAPKERLKELLAYSVSEDYFAVRKHLGVEIEIK